MSRRIVLATWNVHGAVGTDGVYAPARVLRVLERLDADVVALQEVDLRGRADWLADAAHALGYRALTGPTMGDAEQGWFGNALLTRLPVAKVERLDLSVKHREPRGAVVARLSGDPPLTVAATHLGLRRWERALQVAKLLRHLDLTHGGLHVLAGDLNEWIPRSRLLGKLAAKFGHQPPLRTFPSNRPLLALDRIWVHPHKALAAVERPEDPLDRAASDHLPLRAVLAPGNGAAG